jgi:hypothetical protein
MALLSLKEGGGGKYYGPIIIYLSKEVGSRKPSTNLPPSHFENPQNIQDRYDLFFVLMINRFTMLQLLSLTK